LVSDAFHTQLSFFSLGQNTFSGAYSTSFWILFRPSKYKLAIYDIMIFFLQNVSQRKTFPFRFETKPLNPSEFCGPALVQQQPRLTASTSNSWGGGT
jgi:hypothetical protein